MHSIDLTTPYLDSQVKRIVDFISREVDAGEILVVGASGGIDSDVVARLCVESVGRERLKLFTVHQADMDEGHLNNARELAKDLNIHLIELSFQPYPRQLLEILAHADTSGPFNPDRSIDLGKAKNSLRTFVFSMYAEHGYVTVGTSNRTEVETGFYLPFGDGLAHLLPIAHLYKTQVQALARRVGTQQRVIDLPPSAGYWQGETDLADIAVWLVNEAPVMDELDWGTSEREDVRKVIKELSFEKLDQALLSIYEGGDVDSLVNKVGFSLSTAVRLVRLLASSRRTKGRLLGKRLES